MIKALHSVGMEVLMSFESCITTHAYIATHTQVIKALHSAGMEVLMSFEFCITAEGSDAGRSGGLQGMRGLDAGVYYRWV